MSTLIREEKFIKSDVVKNNNKYWYIEQYDDHKVITKWGRVGDTGQSKTYTFSYKSEADSFVEDKIKEKTKSGRNHEIAYRKIELIENGKQQIVSKNDIVNHDLKKVVAQQIKSTNKIVNDLIDYLTKTNAHQILEATGGKITFSDTTGMFSTPLGIVTQTAIDKANEILVQISDKVEKRDYDNIISNLTNDYLMLIPQDIGHSRLDVKEFWSSTSKIKSQKQILDGLQTSYTNLLTSKDTIKPDVDVPALPVIFNVELDMLNDSTIFSKLNDKFEKTKKHNHYDSNKYKIDKVYTVKIANERQIFEDKGKKLGNIMQLFHGTSTPNILSIMKQGLIIPPATASHVCGRMFGNGSYFASSSSKALNYSIGFWGGKTATRVFMFMADVAMGSY